LPQERAVYGFDVGAPMAGIRFLHWAVVVTILLAGAGSSPTIAAGNDPTAIPGSFKATTDVDTGEYSNQKMSVEVVLAPGDETGLSSLLMDVYDANGPTYHHWLGKGEFYSRFAPIREHAAEIENHLRANGLTVEPSSSPFLVRASGSSDAVATAFGTAIHTYRNPRGIAYYSNASTVHLPASINSGVLGVVGLSNTVRAQSHMVRPLTPASPTASCESPYPSKAQLLANVVNGTPIPLGYGGGPGCNGLTPSQVNSLYNAPNLGPRSKGAGVNLAVVELSAYQQSDITIWAHTFYGTAYTPPLVDITVDGGPLHPICPSNDACPPQFNGYWRDGEVDEDIEMQLAISPYANPAGRVHADRAG
jgi:subtilase family serine protease